MAIGQKNDSGSKAAKPAEEKVEKPAESLGMRTTAKAKNQPVENGVTLKIETNVVIDGNLYLMRDALTEWPDTFGRAFRVTRTLYACDESGAIDFETKIYPDLSPEQTDLILDKLLRMQSVVS